ncbi:MAG TPA: YbhB/YbcL family Raf kinase inhibitor-like protein [Polyangiaceae bacterium]|nr:YbhB/YbcL family Raf kinase inhibitor-like protein [Polyangiaceae bacterium]
MATIPPENTCASAVGDISPELDWTGAPAATKSYAIVLKDLCNMYSHWAVWDIPASAMQLPVMAADGGAMLTMPAGAKELSFRGTRYAGPCPSGSLHVYRFTVYALDVAMLPGTNGLNGASGVAMIDTIATMHSLAKATLAGTSNASQH